MEQRIFDLLRNQRMLLIVLVIAGGHFVWMMDFFEPAISSPDANGYFAQAQLIATEGRTWFSPESLLQYVGGHWIDTGDGRFFSRYPPGLPIIASVFFAVAGHEAALLVNPVLTSFTLLGLFLLCGLWIGDRWAVLAVVAMVFNPVVNSRALTHDAHAAVAFFLIWGLYLIARWSVSKSVVVAFFAGLFLGMIPTVRYPEGLFGFAIALFVLNSVYEDRKSVIAAITGALIPVGALMVRNHYAFGGFWKTGYSLTNEQTGFAWSYFVAHGPQYLQNILGEGVGVFAALGVFGMALLCAQHSTRRYGLLLTGLVLPTTLLYMAYYFMMGDGVVSLRFLLPTFYLYVIAGMWGLKLMRDAMGQSVYVGVAAVMVVTVFWGYPQSAQTLARLEKTNGVLAAISQTVQEQVKSGEVVIAPGGIQQHLNFVGNWRLIESSIFLEPRDMSRMVDRFGGSDMPNPMGHAVGRREAQAQYWDETMYGPSSRLFEDLNTWAGGAVYWVGTYEEMMAHVPTSDSLQVVAKIELPRVEDAESRRGRGRRGGGMPDGFRGGPPAGGRGGPMPAFSGNENLLLAKWIPHSAGS